MAKVPNHSAVIISDDEEYVASISEVIQSYCKSGIKVLLFSKCSDDMINSYRSFCEAGLFNYYPLARDILKRGESPTIVVDGEFRSVNDEDLLKRLGGVSNGCKIPNING